MIDDVSGPDLRATALLACRSEIPTTRFYRRARIAAPLHGESHARRRVLRALTAIATGIMAATACNGVSNPAAGSPIVGTYRLVLVNGSALPALAGSTYVLTGSVTLQSNVDFSASETDSLAGQPATTFSASGKWSVTAASLTLRNADATAYYGTFNSQLDTLVATINGHVGTYAKQ